ncbi:cation transporter [Fibrobacter sp. UWB4]|uniref:cation diffusion facilitator family transporter n=1 Tax=Fibrobacter sp. UWB4 TaxID=1964356 RepID=UPI000B528C92|nr:cation diffusion facilitator family transporter [Fibrobacter sp. UWB4]OWV18797.1 cation transporter [Fibrobacter sp. UWB4]
MSKTETLNNIDKEENRNKVIVKTSVVGIVTNVILASVKAVIGLMANSIAVVLDAVNNLSDALSSIITIVGNKLSRKLPNEKHPLGYGRIEYLTAMVIASIVIYAGITSCVESIKKIIHPEEADYSTVSLVIIAIAVVVKVVLGRYVKSQGERVNSGSLIASGSDALFDAILSLSVLASALIFIFTGLSLEAYVGVLISIFIVKAGFEMLKDTVSDLLGKKNDNELTKQIKSLIRSEEGVHGAYDLVINDYGPEKKLASVHVELPDTMTVADLDSLTRKIEKKVYSETGVILTAIGVYSYNTQNDESAKIRDTILDKVKSHDWALQMHGFYVDIEAKEMRFDVVIKFGVNAQEALETIKSEAAQLYPDYKIQVSPDIDLG